MHCYSLVQTYPSTLSRKKCVAMSESEAEQAMEKEESPRAMLEEPEKEEEKEEKEDEDKVAGDLEDEAEEAKKKEQDMEEEDTVHTEHTEEDRKTNAKEEPTEPTPVEEDVKPITAAPSKRHSDNDDDAPPRKSSKLSDGAVESPQTRPVARVLIGVSGTTSTAEASANMAQEAQLQKLVTEGDYAGAAALQKEMAKSPVNEETYQAKLNLLLANQDYAGAAKLQAEVKGSQSRVDEDAHEAELARLVSIEDYAGAAKLKEEKQKRPDNQHVLPRANAELQRALAAAATARTAATQAARALEARNLGHAAEIQRLLAKTDYAAAAEYEKEKKAMTEEYQAKSKLAVEQESILSSMGGSLPTADSSQATAPLVQAGIAVSTSQAGQSTSEQAQIRAYPRNCVKVTVEQLMQTSAPMPSEVKLEGVRILSYSKISSVPAQKGKNKGKGKANTKGKSKGKDGKVGKTDNGRQDAKFAYVGQDKHIIAIATFGDDTQHLLDDFIGCSVDIQGLRPRPGQMGTLYWSAATSIVKRPDSHESDIPLEFEYDTTATTKDLATISHMQEYNKGDYVALVIRPQSVEEQWTQNDESYLLVHGYDMDRVATGPMRFWRHELGDIIEGKIYLIRGLKVVDQTYWSEDVYKYVPKEDGTKTVEISFRTAIEDLTAVTEIATYFT